MLREHANRRFARRHTAEINAGIDSAECEVRIAVIQCESPNRPTRERIARLRGNGETGVHTMTAEPTSSEPARRFPRKKARFGRKRRKERRRNFGVRRKATMGIKTKRFGGYVLIKRRVCGSFEKVDFRIVRRRCDLRSQRNARKLRDRRAKRPQS